MNIKGGKMKREIVIKYKKRKIKIIAEDCNFLKKFTGLMFSNRQNSRALLFSFRRKQKIMIHSFYVFYSFIALWLDEKNNIVDLKIVKPFSLCISPQKSTFRLVEIPINDYYQKIVKIFI
jgi:uncharacterized membrane protein (UPF0127 family)